MRQSVSTLDFDFSPLFRSGVGFDRMMRLMEDLPKNTGTCGYQPYNIEKIGDDAYRIELAVAGFNEQELEVETEGNTLSIRGDKPKTEEEEARQYLHRGIATRSFEQNFRLADHIEVKGAELKNGMLVIEMQRNVPEQLKPRQIPIGKAKNLISGKKK